MAVSVKIRLIMFIPVSGRFVVIVLGDEGVT